MMKPEKDSRRSKAIHFSEKAKKKVFASKSAAPTICASTTVSSTAEISVVLTA